MFSNTGLKSRTDDAFLLRFLRARKFDRDRAHKLLVNYYTIRANNRDLIGHITPSCVESIYDTGIGSLLPHRDREGRSIMYVRPGVFAAFLWTFVSDLVMIMGKEYLIFNVGIFSHQRHCLWYVDWQKLHQ